MQRSKSEIAKDIEATGLKFAPLMQQMSELLAELEESMGWLDDVEGAKQEAAEFVANVGGEVSEWWEHWRNGVLFEQSKKAEKAGVELTNEAEEVADIIIRAMAYAGRRPRDSHVAANRRAHLRDNQHDDIRLPIGEAIVIKSLINTTRERRHGGKQA